MLCFGTRMVFSWIVPVVPQGFLFRLLCFCVCPFVAFGFVWVAFACVWLCLWGVRVFLCDLFGDLGLVLDPLSEALPPCGTRMLFLDSLWEGLSMPFGSRQAFLRLCGGCLCEVFVLRRSHAYYPWGGRINLSVKYYAVCYVAVYDFALELFLIRRSGHAFHGSCMACAWSCIAVVLSDIFA